MPDLHILVLDDPLERKHHLLGRRHISPSFPPSVILMKQLNSSKKININHFLSIFHIRVLTRRYTLRTASAVKQNEVFTATSLKKLIGHRSFLTCESAVGTWESVSEQRDWL